MPIAHAHELGEIEGMRTPAPRQLASRQPGTCGLRGIAIMSTGVSSMMEEFSFADLARAGE